MALASLVGIPLGILVALRDFPGKRLLQQVLNTLMALPTVVVGLLLYGLLTRQGALGHLGLLYTIGAIIIGQTLLILPIIWNLSIAAASGADPRLLPTSKALGASTLQQGAMYVNEVRYALAAAMVAGFGRAIGEVGIAMMLGGNIEGFTRTMTTAIALETSKGRIRIRPGPGNTVTGHGFPGEFRGTALPGHGLTRKLRLWITCIKSPTWYSPTAAGRCSTWTTCISTTTG